MSRARLIITAITTQGLSQAEAARTYGVSEATVSRYMARWRSEGETAFEPRSRAPKSSPTATPPERVELVLALRKQLIEAGLDAGAETIGWHLEHHHQAVVSRATIHRILTRHGVITPEPKKRPKSSYVRFEATMPNETWQSDFTHYRLATGADVEVLTWLDDCTRYAIRVTAHRAVTAIIVRDEFRQAVRTAGIPASTLTDNGMVFTTRHASRPGKNALEAELRRLHIIQKNGRPGRPTTQGKVERFQQTMKKWLRAQPDQPGTIGELQALLEEFVDHYNHRRPHRSLPHRATPAARYEALPKALPTSSRDAETHARVRHDRVDTSGVVTLRIAGRLHHIGIGRTHARTHVVLLIADLHVRVVNATTGELLRELQIDPTRDYQPQKQQGPNPLP